MTEQIEARVRAATPTIAGTVDFSVLQSRVTARRRHRRVAGVLAVAVLAVTVGLVVGSGGLDNGNEPARHVELPVTPAPIVWNQTSSIPGAQVFAIASNKNGVIAIGDTGAFGGGSNLTAMIWYSPDGVSWQATYSESPVKVNPGPQGGLGETSTTFRKAYSTTHGFVLIADHSETDGTIARILTSKDGHTWQQVSDRPFQAASNAKRKDFSSRIYDLTEHNGTLVAVGDLFTNNHHQRAGLSPCIWTSSDGTHWSRHIADLGHGYDPYFTTITVHRDTFVAGGQTGKFPAVAWISRDLIHWDHVTITPQGFANITTTPDGYIAAGDISVGTKKHRAYEPALWQSNDAQHWYQVLRLPRAASRTYFAFVATAGDTLIAVGQHQTASGTQTPLLYESADGRTWIRLDPIAAGFPSNSLLSGYGTIAKRFVIAGTTPTFAGTVFWTTTR